ncbi:MAG: type VI secretion system ATPase TssH [Planctomycetia bacterium]|nr:MAG: type VI secretion system ATPase TssH [Planctomycetia bacterium]
MISVNLKSVVARLNDTCRASLESAAGLCLSRTNYNLEIEHWLLKLLETEGTDVQAVLRHYQVDVGRLKRDLTAAVDKFRTGNTRPPALSPDTVDLARDAWLLASVEYESGRARSGHLLASLLLDESRGRLARELSGELAKIPADALRRELPSITADTTEAATAVSAAPGSPDAGVRRPGDPSKTPALDQFTIDLTERARQGRIDPVLGRDSEVRQIVDILMRRRQNNPILTGEAGVGKTAVVEGFAQRLADGDVPPPLRGVVLRSLDLGLLQAGASVKGEFENRLRAVIEEVKGSPVPIILFIDEAHMLVGAGGQAGQGDAANLMKPALARGELRTIAATTWAEYKKYFEKDPALTRRFQVVKVDEPTEDIAVQMMRGMVQPLEKHHRVRVLDEAVAASVRLSMRYITARQLPDKSVSLLDTACARVAVARKAVPPMVEDLRREIAQLGVKIDILARERAAGTDHDEAIRDLEKRREEATASLASAEERWKAEAALVDRLLVLREELESGCKAPPAQPDAPPPAASPASAPKSGDKPDAPAKSAAPAKPKPVKLTDEELSARRVEFDKLTAELAALQGERPLISPYVNQQVIAEVVSGWTGIPVGRMVSDEIRTVLQLKERLEDRIVGQSHALEAIAQSIRTSRADLTDPNKPIGVFLMPGPSGVGKTETALALAELLYGGEQNVNVINMSEFKEEHKVSLLMGSPPGYVGYGEGGILTEAVRRRPYSVLLLDEMEKAHPGVQDVFYQVFDKGMMRDGEGRDINFKNSVIIMTSNAASDVIMKLCADKDTRPTSEGLAKAVYPELLKTFKPAFLGRCTIVPFFPLSDDVLRSIVRLKLNKIVRRMRASYGATLSYTPGLVETIASRCTEVESGARNVDNIVSRSLLPELSAQILSRMANAERFGEVAIDVSAEGAFTYRMA